MSQAEEFERKGSGLVEADGFDRSRNGAGRKDATGVEARPLHAPREFMGRPLGSSLPAGGMGKPLSAAVDEGAPSRPGPPPLGRSLQPRSEDRSPDTQWAAGAMKQVMPFMQRLLPLIDGNIASALSSLIASRPAPQPAPTIDLQPIETGITELQGTQRELRTQILDHNTSLKRVEDHLEMVREATDRNTLEQQELIEDLKAMGSRVNLFALTLLTLLVLSVLLNLFLFLHIQRVLP